MNANLAKYFPGFPIDSFDIYSLGLLRYKIYNRHNNQFTYGSGTNNTYSKMLSDAGPELLMSWHQAKGLFFKSNNIRVRDEILPSLDQTGKINNYVNGTSIIANFDFEYDANSISPLFMQYKLSTPYKVMDIMNPEAIRNIDFQIFWYDKYNNAFPLHLSQGESLSIRFVFMKK